MFFQWEWPAIILPQGASLRYCRLARKGCKRGDVCRPSGLNISSAYFSPHPRFGGEGPGVRGLASNLQNPHFASDAKPLTPQPLSPEYREAAEKVRSVGRNRLFRP